MWSTSNCCVFKCIFLLFSLLNFLLNLKEKIYKFFKMVKFLNGKQNFNLKFVDYSQSSKCRNRRDSSVSYASASCILD